MSLLPPVPGGNVFLASEDLTSPADADGNHLVTCRRARDTPELKWAFEAYKLLSRLAG
jgi:hypothetical protein